MATKKTSGKAAGTATKKKAPTRGKRKAKPAQSAGLAPDEIAADASAAPDDVKALAASIAEDGGAVLAQYKDPLAGGWVTMAALPLEKVAPTPYQRDVSEAHVDKLTDAIQRTGHYLDPIIAIRQDGTYFTPNGGHRLASLTRLGTKAITALVLADPRLAFKILALNVEKAHALKERALEVIRMVRELQKLGGKETDYVSELEDPAYITLGACYEENARFAGSAYHPILKKCDDFLDVEMEAAVQERERRAARLLEVEAKVAVLIKGLKEKGFDSPYLRNFVVARINPLRFSKRGGKHDFDETLDKLNDKADKFDLGKVKDSDVSKASGGPS